MKIIALFPAKNEEWILRSTLPPLLSIADEVVVLDDGSIDRTADIVRELGGHILKLEDRAEKVVDMSRRRMALLEEGRKRGGTHFIWLDADEVFSANFLPQARQVIGELKPGEKLLLRWVALWKSPRAYRDDGSVYSNIYKDFAVCDDPSTGFNKKFLSESRTPGPFGEVKRIDESRGVVLHFQFAAWERNLMKQAWYRCSELVEGSRSARRINNTYAITLDDETAGTKPVPDKWIEGLDLNRDFTGFYDWHFKAIMAFFDTYGIEFFEPLQIWHIKELEREFVKRAGRQPKSKVFHPLLVELNKVKNYFKNKYWD